MRIQRHSSSSFVSPYLRSVVFVMRRSPACVWLSALSLSWPFAFVAVLKRRESFTGFILLQRVRYPMSSMNIVNFVAANVKCLSKSIRRPIRKVAVTPVTSEAQLMDRGQSGDVWLSGRTFCRPSFSLDGNVLSFSSTIATSLSRCIYPPI